MTRKPWISLPQTTLPYWREEVEVQAIALRSWILLAGSRESEALESARAAADREDAVDKHPVTPGEVIPARELHADMLLETGDTAGALAQYQAVLAGSPNRLNALLGAASAAARAGNEALADSYYETVRAQTAAGNRERRGLAPAWAAVP